MARKVKCQDTGEYSTSDVAYKGMNGKYYSSENAYKKIQSNKEYRMKCINEMYEILGYKEYMKIPTFFYKKLKEYEGYGYEIVYRTIKDTRNNMEWALMNKSFNGETAKIMYICAIIDNHITDAMKEIAKEKKMVSSVKDSNVIDMVDISDLGNNKKGRDVSSLLGDL